MRLNFCYSSFFFFISGVVYNFKVICERWTQCTGCKSNPIGIRRFLPWIYWAYWPMMIISYPRIHLTFVCFVPDQFVLLQPCWLPLHRGCPLWGDWLRTMRSQMLSLVGCHYGFLCLLPWYGFCCLHPEAFSQMNGLAQFFCSRSQIDFLEVIIPPWFYMAALLISVVSIALEKLFADIESLIRAVLMAT